MSTPPPSDVAVVLDQYQHHHIHWDCSYNGILSSQVLYAASINALQKNQNCNDDDSNNKNDKNDSYKTRCCPTEKLMFDLNELIGLLIPLEMDCSVRCNIDGYIEVNINEGSKVPNVTRIQQHVVQVFKEMIDKKLKKDSLIEKLMNESLLLQVDDGKGYKKTTDCIPLLSVKAAMMAYETLLNFSTGKEVVVDEDQDQEDTSTNATTVNDPNHLSAEVILYLMHVSYIVGTIIIVTDYLHVQSFSCSPIPINKEQLQQYSIYFVNCIPIQLIYHESIEERKCCDITLDGVCLMQRFLRTPEDFLNTTTSSLSPQQHVFSSRELLQVPPMILSQPISTGYKYHEGEDLENKKTWQVSMNNNNNNNNLSTGRRRHITLMIGKVMSQNYVTSTPVKSVNENSSVLISNDKKEENTKKKEENTTITNRVEPVLLVQPLLPPQLTPEEDLTVNEMLLLETNIDDMTSEHIAHATDIILNKGHAADVWITPIIMKKGRPAYTLHCLCKSYQKDNIMEFMFRYTTTLGIRIQKIERIALKRQIITTQIYSNPTKNCFINGIQHPNEDNNESNDDNHHHHKFIGTIDVKIRFYHGEILSMKAEYEHCKVISNITNQPLHEVANNAVEITRQLLKVEGGTIK